MLGTSTRPGTTTADDRSCFPILFISVFSEFGAKRQISWGRAPRLPPPPPANSLRGGMELLWAVGAPRTWGQVK